MSTLRSLILVTLSTVVFSFLFELVWTVPGHAQQLPDQCLDNLPTPTPIAPSHRVVQLVNCTYVTLLGAANAAGQSDQELVSVLPLASNPISPSFEKHRKIALSVRLAPSSA